MNENNVRTYQSDRRDVADLFWIIMAIALTAIISSFGVTKASCQALPLSYADVPAGDDTSIKEIKDVCMHNLKRDPQASRMLEKIRQTLQPKGAANVISYRLIGEREDSISVQEKSSGKQKISGSSGGSHLHRRVLPNFEGWMFADSTHLGIGAISKIGDSYIFDASWPSIHSGLAVVARITVDPALNVPIKISRVTSSCTFPQSQIRYVRTFREYSLDNGYMVPHSVSIYESGKSAKQFKIENIQAGAIP